MLAEREEETREDLQVGGSWNEAMGEEEGGIPYLT